MCALASFLAPWRLEGGEYVPRSGGYILVANHINWKDPPWIEFALRRAIRYMGKRELFETPVIGFLLRRMERSFAAAGALAERLDRLSLDAGRPIGLALARRVLAESSTAD